MVRKWLEMNGFGEKFKIDYREFRTILVSPQQLLWLKNDLYLRWSIIDPGSSRYCFSLFEKRAI